MICFASRSSTASLFPTRDTIERILSCFSARFLHDVVSAAPTRPLGALLHPEPTTNRGAGRESIEAAPQVLTSKISRRSTRCSSARRRRRPDRRALVLGRHFRTPTARWRRRRQPAQRIASIRLGVARARSSSRILTPPSCELLHRRARGEGAAPRSGARIQTGIPRRPPLEYNACANSGAAASPLTARGLDADLDGPARSSSSPAPLRRSPATRLRSTRTKVDLAYFSTLLLDLAREGGSPSSTYFALHFLSSRASRLLRELTPDDRASKYAGHRLRRSIMEAFPSLSCRRPSSTSSPNEISASRRPTSPSGL